LLTFKNKNTEKTISWEEKQSRIRWNCTLQQKKLRFSGIQATGTIDTSMFNGDYRCFPHVNAAAAPLQMLEKRCISKFLIEKR